MNNESVFLHKVDETIQIHMKKHNVVGGAIGVIENSKIISIKPFGYADKQRKKKVDLNTLFQAGSLSKTITAWGIMKLVEDGRLELDQAVNDVLKGYTLLDTRYPSNEVTIKRLLSHTAGISIRSYLGYNSPQSARSKEVFVDDLKIKYQPATTFRYSGGGYSLLQLVIESVTNMPFERFMKNEVFMPLGMNYSTFNSDSISDEMMSKCYGLLAQKVKHKFYIEKAAAGLYTNIVDLASFVQKNIYSINENELDNQLLRSNTIKTMHTRVSQQIPYGLGYYSYTLAQNKKLIMHNGKNRGWRSKFLLFPEQGDGIVFLTNCDRSNAFIADIVKQYMDWKVPDIVENYREGIGMINSGVISNTKTYLKYISSLAMGKHWF